MYQCGDQVLYGMHGVCTILSTELQMVDRKCVEYYVLEPLEQPGTRYYVPTQNQTAVSKMRKVLTAQELEALLASEEASADAWIQDESQRKQYYRELIGSPNRAAMLSMVRTLHKHKKEQAAAGRTFHQCDANFLRDAQKLLDTEFSLVLNIAPADVEGYVLNAMKME